VSGIPVTGVSELVLEVADLDAAERFYAGALGLPVVERWSQRPAVWLLAGDRTRIGLWLGEQVGIAGGRGGSHVHFALHLAPEEYDPALERLRGLGFEPHEEVFPRYDRSRSLYVDDPDGNVVELWTFDVARHLEMLGT
jgi:catechol 2,3-dioxygenase-like lactoylglutathione lyase family enzyme